MSLSSMPAVVMTAPRAGGRYLVSETPRIMVVEGSRMVRRMIEEVLRRELPGARVVHCESVAAARLALASGAVDLVTTALLLPDGDGMAVAAAVRAMESRVYVPVIVVSSEVEHRLCDRRLSEHVTDYFDKSLGHRALAEFLRGYVHPEPIPGAQVLYVEDNKLVAKITMRMLCAQGLSVAHVHSGEEAIARLDQAREGATGAGIDLVLTDLFLAGPLGGHDVLAHVRRRCGFSKRAMPVLVLTGDEDVGAQRELLRAGANDLVVKPVEERLLMTKVLFQLRAARLRES